MEKNADTIFIVKKSILATTDGHLLKLNRAKQQLEVYKKIDNDELHNYYSIKKDFDLSKYVVFQKEYTFGCIIGGKDTPTPTGIFKIESKSKGQYISTYHPDYDKVKFFGYLAVFEDYFIHSDMYRESVTEDMMLHNKQAEPIGGGDLSTSGCIRVSQENIDWLVENIAVNTTIIL